MRYFCWDPYNETKEDGKWYEADHAAQAAEQYAEEKTEDASFHGTLEYLVQDPDGTILGFEVVSEFRFKATQQRIGASDLSEDDREPPPPDTAGKTG